MLDNAGENFFQKVFPRTPFQKLSKAELLYLFGNLKTIEHQDLKFFGTPFSKERCETFYLFVSISKSVYNHLAQMFFLLLTLAYLSGYNKNIKTYKTKGREQI